jgi:hypothetical protein
MLDRIKALRRDGQDLDARLLLAAYTTQIASAHGVGCILVGGSAVDFYTAATLESASGAVPGPLRGSVDLDFVAVATPARHDAVKLREALASEGFTPVGGAPRSSARTWSHPDERGLLIDVMSSDLEGSLEHVRVLTISGIDVQIIGPEDLFLQYLKAAIATAHRHDYTRAVALALTHEADMDWQYINDFAPPGIPARLIDHVRQAGAYADALRL